MIGKVDLRNKFLHLDVEFEYIPGCGDGVTMKLNFDPNHAGLPSLTLVTWGFRKSQIEELLGSTFNQSHSGSGTDA